MVCEKIIQSIIDYLKPYGIKEIGIFGSFARNSDTAESDIDVLFDYTTPLSLFQHVKMQRELSALVGKKIDLVSKRSVRPGIMEFIKNDLKVVYHA